MCLLVFAIEFSVWSLELRFVIDIQNKWRRRGWHMITVSSSFSVVYFISKSASVRVCMCVCKIAVRIKQWSLHWVSHFSFFCRMKITLRARHEVSYHSLCDLFSSFNSNNTRKKEKKQQRNQMKPTIQIGWSYKRENIDEKRKIKLKKKEERK